MKTSTFIMLAVVAVIVVIGASYALRDDRTELPPVNNGNEEKSTDSIKLMQNPRVGQYFTDGEGMALYIFTKDTGTQSSCVGQCLVNWPIFYAEDLELPAGLNEGDFGETVTPDGQKISTYQGWPLYYYIGDQNAGDINGEGVGDVWYVAKQGYKALFATGAEGNYLVDENGRTLYYFTRDSRNTSACTGDCLANWPLFHDEDNFVPTTVTSIADFGEIRRPDGQEQTTYKGWPLYYYVNDKARGDRLGQGVGDVWFMVDPTEMETAPVASGS